MITLVYFVFCTSYEGIRAFSAPPRRPRILLVLCLGRPPEPETSPNGDVRVSVGSGRHVYIALHTRSSQMSLLAPCGCAARWREMKHLSQYIAPQNGAVVPYGPDDALSSSSVRPMAGKTLVLLLRRGQTSLVAPFFSAHHSPDRAGIFSAGPTTPEAFPPMRRKKKVNNACRQIAFLT